jgi:hypothetical protein
MFFISSSFADYGLMATVAVTKPPAFAIAPPSTTALFTIVGPVTQVPVPQPDDDTVGTPPTRVYVFDVTDFTSPARPAALYVNSEPADVLLYAEEVAPFEAPEPFVPTTPVFVPTNENVEPSAERFIDGDVSVVEPVT